MAWIGLKTSPSYILKKLIYEKKIKSKMFSFYNGSKNIITFTFFL